MNLEYFSDPVRMAVETAVRVGSLIASGKWSRAVSMKAHPTLGTASVTESDIQGQAAILERISSQYPSARFLAEEEGNTFPAQGSEELVFSLDAIDGTTPYSRSLGVWCTALGVMQAGKPTGGVVHAPEVLGGLTIAAEMNHGVFLYEISSPVGISVQIAEEPSSKPLVMLGVNMLHEPYAGIISALPPRLKPKSIAQSGALGLAFVAVGRVDALIQFPQMPWDLIPGYPMVLEAGGAFQCFHYEKGHIVAVESPTVVDYDSTRETLGFVAGKAGIVHEIFAVLQRIV